MITYGRVHLLQEALHSFLIQDWGGESELIIVNDYPLQKLIFDHPRVKIFNLDTTFLTIGDKENFAIEQCSGDLIAVWDDDDIAMPWHLSNIAHYWKPDTNLLHWRKGVFYNEPNITSLTYIGNSGIVYSKKAWEAIGKSPIENAGGDTTMVQAIHALGGEYVVRAAPDNEKVSWFYRWALPMNYHQSGMGRDVEGKPDIIQRNAIFVETMRSKGKIPTGDIHLRPKWRFDYEQILKDFNAG